MASDADPRFGGEGEGKATLPPACFWPAERDWVVPKQIGGGFDGADHPNREVRRRDSSKSRLSGLRTRLTIANVVANAVLGCLVRSVRWESGV